MPAQRILVTGASGFIGSHLTRALVQSGVPVSVLLRRPYAQGNPRLADIWNRILPIEGDVRFRSDCEAAVRGHTLVYHLAAYHHVGESWKHPHECHESNVRGSDNMAWAAWQHGAKLVYVSSSEIYGDQPVPWREDSRPQPVSPYAITKYAGELSCEAYRRQGLRVSIVRPFNTYGPEQSERAVIGELLRRLSRGETVKMSAGEQTREFIFVDDTVRGLITAAGADYEGAINLASGIEHEIRDVAGWCMAAMMSGQIELGALPYRPNEIMRMCGDGERARTLLDWRPQVPLSDGIARTAESIKNGMYRATVTVQ